MIQRTYDQIARMAGCEKAGKINGECLIKGVTIDSRKISSGSLFVPFKGEQVDGHQYVEEAIKKGAAAAFWQKDVPNPPKHLPLFYVDDTLQALQRLAKSYRQELDVKVVGITGSNGKTSTKDITTSILSLKYKVQKTEGNYNNHIGLPLTVLNLEEDTEIAVLEMGMSGKGEIDFLSQLAEPDIVVITNIGESHLLDLGSREGIAEAKLEILNGLKENGRFVYFGDEPLLKENEKKEAFDTVTFGLDSSNDLYPTHIQAVENGSVFSVNKSDISFTLPILGNHNILNALAAMLVADYFAVPYADMKKGLQQLTLTNMRMELLDSANGGKVINDAYNASPTSMLAAIQVVQTLPGFSKKVMVLGDMLELGEQEESYHFELGKQLAGIDLLFTYGELGAFIANGAKTILSEEKVRSFKDKKELIHELKEVINPQTLVLVKGSRGMKLEEVVKALL